MMTVMMVMIMAIMMVAPIMIERNFHSGPLLFEKKVIFAAFLKTRKGPTDRPTDRRTDGPTYGPTDGRTNPLIEMRGRI